MQTRRRHHLQDNHDFGIQDQTQTITFEQQQQPQQLTHNHISQLHGGGSSAINASYPIANESSAILIDEHHSNNTSSGRVDLDTDDKYLKAAGRSQLWNLQGLSSLSTRIQQSSGQALRTFIQQPLSAAAAVVTGNHRAHETAGNIYHSSIINTPSDNNSIEFEEFLEDKDPDNNIVVMASRDRTSEFSNAIRSLQARNISRAINVRDPRKVKEVQNYTEFMMVAKYIGKNIASTYAKLEKLTLLARKRTLFDDRPQEIQELTYIIKGDLNALNQQIARLQDISKDQRRNHSSGKHLISHTSNMVLALQSKLANMSSDFKTILEVRTENLKQQKTRRDQFGQGAPLPVNSVPPATAKQGSLLLSEENQAVSIDMSGGDTSPLLGRLQTQQQQQIAVYDQSDDYLQERAETMQNIESTIVELGGIFQQLATMVKEQEEIVDRIDTNVQDAELNIEAAHGEILKYFQSVSKNRWLMIKIFGVLIFFFIFFVMFMA